MKLRDYQVILDKQIDNSWLSNKNVMAVSPTGSGKSVIISNIVKKNNGGVCVIAHRQELVSQMSLHLARDGIYHNIISSISVYKNIVKQHLKKFGKSWVKHDSKVAVAGVDTLIRRGDKLKRWLPTVTLWVVDEAHHLLKDNKWGKAVAMFPNARGLGVTATPLRLDGKGLGSKTHGCIDDLIVGVDMRDLINRNFLTDYKIYAPVVKNLKLSDIKVTGSGEFSKTEINNAVEHSSLILHENSTMVGDVVNHYIKYANNTLAVVFVSSIDIGDEISSQFNTVGISACMLSAKNSDYERSSTVSKFENGDIKVLLNVGLFDEGFDLPAIQTVIMASPTMSYGKYVQMFGRGLRLMNNKSFALILDLVGNVAQHGLPDRKINWSLAPAEKCSNSKKREINPLKTCDSCAYVYERFLKECPSCGAIPQLQERSIEQVDGDLTELDPIMLAKLRGEIILKDRPVDDLVDDYVANMKVHVNNIFNQSNIKKFRLKCEENKKSQYELRKEMAIWAGWHRYNKSDNAEIFKKFYIEFGIDWLYAQALESKYAEILKVQIIKITGEIWKK